MADKEYFSVVSYTLGILSIVFAFFNPLAGLVLGIIGFTQSKKQKTDISKKAKKFNKIGIILSIIFLVIQIAVMAYAAIKGLPSNFPLI